MTPFPKIIFAGDRALSVNILKFMLAQGCKPEALLVVDGPGASHAEEFKSLCNFLPPERIIVGKNFRSAESVTLLREVDPEYIIGIHYPYIIPKEVLEIPRRGFLNLHPAYLPYNRGWHTPSWAIIDGTPYGATLHLMKEELDEGDILAQKELPIDPTDTANSLYQKVLALEYDVFVDFWPHLVSGAYVPAPQDHNKMTSHKKSDMAGIQEIDLNKTYPARELIDKLRALTTNNIAEAAYIVVEGTTYRIQVHIEKDTQ
jgi:methionyl-tRNA formyltransferase